MSMCLPPISLSPRAKWTRTLKFYDQIQQGFHTIILPKSNNPHNHTLILHKEKPFEICVAWLTIRHRPYWRESYIWLLNAVKCKPLFEIIFLSFDRIIKHVITVTRFWYKAICVWVPVEIECDCVAVDDVMWKWNVLLGMVIHFDDPDEAPKKSCQINGNFEKKIVFLAINWMPLVTFPTSQKENNNYPEVIYQWIQLGNFTFCLSTDVTVLCVIRAPTSITSLPCIMLLTLISPSFKCKQRATGQLSNNYHKMLVNS